MKRVATGLNIDTLRQLIDGEVLAIRSPGFYSESACQLLSSRLRVHQARSSYANGPHIGRIGISYFESTAPSDRERYYAEAATTLSDLRSASEPYPYPIDLLLVALCQMWPGGARVECLEQRDMFFGLVRILEVGPGARPHQDVLAWDAPADCSAARELRVQLSANVYLRTADEGGELELWDMNLDREAYAARKLANAVALDRGLLPPPTVQIRPEMGEIILLRSSSIHSIREVIRGTRITASTFIGVRQETAALSVWS